ncbi:MAG: ribosome small subunit-dependent GTPase A [Thermacetogeniaceae bacterium]
MLRGIIVKGYGGFYFVQSEAGLISCRGRGRLKWNEKTLLVGDHVLFNLVGDGVGVIEEVLPRKNALIRPPVANVDQAILVFALIDPEPDLKLLDRLLILCGVEKIEVIICLNKVDLVAEQDGSSIADIYRSAGYEVIFTSALQKIGIDKLAEKIKGKISVVAGPSGAGKSSILNALEPGMSLKTGEISRKLRRGRHTTRHVELLRVADGLIADTPGFSNLHLPDNMKAVELGSYFPEINNLAGQCRFVDCLHFREPDCAVKKAVDSGAISLSRYHNYLAFLREVMEKERTYE